MGCTIAKDKRITQLELREIELLGRIDMLEAEVCLLRKELTECQKQKIKEM